MTASPPARPLAGAALPVVVEARHVRLTAAHVELLFGAGHTLAVLAQLEHTERFAAVDVVVVRGPAGSLVDVRVVGPATDASAVLVNAKDLAALGNGSDRGATCSIEGPRGTVVLAGECVLPVRRLVVPEAVASAQGLKAGDGVDVIVHGERARELRGIPVAIGRALYLGLDIDDANAMDIGPTTRAKLARDLAA